MTFTVYIVWGDGKREQAASVGELGEAAASALGLADGFGRELEADGHPPPIRIEIYRDDRLELSVHVIPGGLLGRKAAPRLRAI